MSKRARFLSPEELEQIASELELESAEVSDFDSDDSLRDPTFNPDSPLHHSDDGGEDDEEDIETVLQDLALREAMDNAAEEDDVENISDTIEWTEYIGRHKTFPFTGAHGLLKDLPADITPSSAFFLLFDDEVLNFIVCETNRFAQQTVESKEAKKHARLNKWTPTNAEEMKKFFGLTIWMGLVRLGSLPDYWATKGIYRLDLPRSIMSRNRFQLLLSMLHFNNNEEIQPGDRLAKIQRLIDILQRKYQEFLSPEEDIVIDETLVPWRGRLIFRQYIPNKTHPYGIKLFKLCSTDGYTWALQVYSGKSATGEREVGLARKVCLSLSKELLNEGRTLFVDNFYTSYELAKEMLQKKTHVVGTLRANKKNIPREILQAKIKKGEMISREDPNGIVVLKWRDTRDVRVLTTKHEPRMVSVRVSKKSALHSDTERTDIDADPQPSTSRDLSSPQPSTSRDISSPQPTTSRDTSSPQPWFENHVESESMEAEDQAGPSTARNAQRRGRKSRRAQEKPIPILAYNKGKAGIDLSDQMASYATTLRKGIKWYKRLGMELLLGLTVVNAWVLYKRATNSKIKIRAFREMLVSDLLDIKHEVTERPRNSLPLSHFLITRMDATGKKLRRKCTGCYTTMQKELGRKEARNKAKMVFTFCELCPGQPQMCLPCFNKTHIK